MILLLSFFYNGYMRKALYNLFIPHEHNNYRSKMLHISSLYIFVAIYVFFQLGLSFVKNQYPGVLGYAANISPDEIIRVTNEKRQASGLSQLSSNPTLSQGAMQKGAHMFAQNYWAHFAPDGTSPWSFFKSVGYAYLFAGENLARDFQNSNEVVNAWMNSATHRENILNSNYSEMGVAVINGVLASEETTLVIQFFGKPSPGYVAQAQTAPSNQVAEVAPVEEKKPAVAVAQVLNESSPTPTIIEKKTVAEVVAKENILQTQPSIALLNAKLSALDVTVGRVRKGLFLGLSSYDLSRVFSFALLGLLLIVLIIDSIFIVRNKVVRIGGKNLIHISFLVIILIIILLTTAGRIA